MQPSSQTQISRHLAWDTPWSVEFLTTICVIFVVWTIWQLVREGLVSRVYWWILFTVTRTFVAGVLLWMILGPTTVLTRTEIHPRTLSVYVDSSSSMRIQDQPDLAADLRWRLAGHNQTHSLTAADRVVFYATALKRQSTRLNSAIEQQADTTEKQEIATMWRQMADRCRNWLESEELNASHSESLRKLHQELQLTLKNDLQTFLNEPTWITGNDPGDREQRLQRLMEIGDQFVIRCRVFAEELANASIVGNETASSRIGVDTPTRLEHVIPVIRQNLTEWLKTGKETYRVGMAQFAENVASLSLKNWESSLKENDTLAAGTQVVLHTNLSELLKQIRDDAAKQDIAAAVVITDGRHTVDSSEDPRDVVGQLRVPIFFVPIGNGEMKRDVILRKVHAPNSVIQNDKILLEGIVTAHRCAGERCEVRLLESKKVIDTVQVSFKAEQDDQRFRFEVPTNKIGRREFKIELEKLVDEHSSENNNGSVAVEVTDAVLRILLADGRARWEHQYLVNLFNRQDTIEMDQLKFTPVPVGTGRMKKSPRLPETVEEWSEYRVIILGDVSPRQFSQKSQEALRKYVSDRGGSLIVIAGQNDMPNSFAGESLEQLIPVESSPSFSPDKQGYRVELTTEGKLADVMQFAEDLASTEQVWRETSASLPMYYLSAYHKPKPNSQVLLSAIAAKASGPPVDSPAFLCWQTVGAGRVAFFSSPATYQLRNRNGDRYHHRFWGQLVRWIITRSATPGSKCVKLLADKSHYNCGDRSQLTVELNDAEGHPVTGAAPELDVIQRGEVTSNVRLTADPKIPGRYLGSFASAIDGRFSLRARGAHVDQLLKAEQYVDPVQVLIEFEPGLDRELADPRNDRPLLEHLAEQTGGAVLEPTALAELSHVVSLQPRIQESSQKTTLWDRWWCLWVMLGCLSFEWVIRKRVGLA